MLNRRSRVNQTTHTGTRMDRQRRRIRTRRGFRDYTYLGCPLTRNKSPWCFRFCEPDVGGLGRCGRVAPHGLQGETARSIERHNKELLAAHFERLEQMYLADDRNEKDDAGIRIHEGESEIVTPIDRQHLRRDGSLDNGICFKLLIDAASLAANSVVRDVLVRAESFEVRYAHMTPAGELAARGRLVGLSGGQYLTESVVVDSEGHEVCRGAGAFVRSDAGLGSE